MRRIIDADTHIAESPGMWNLIDPKMYPRRPVMVSAPDDTLYRDFNALWLIDGKIFPKASGKGGFRIITPAASKREAGRTDIALGCREITDVPARLADMDKAGVVVQVIYPTLFLIHVTDDVELQAALCGAYNRYLAQVFQQANGRLRWVTVLPLASVDASIEQMHEAKQNGAVGIFFSGIIGSLTLIIRISFPFTPKRKSSICPSASTPARAAVTCSTSSISSSMAPLPRRISLRSSAFVISSRVRFLKNFPL